MASPIGRLELVEAHGALTGIRFDAPADGTAGHERGGSPVLTAAHRQLSEYFEGRRREFDLPLRPAGTEFQRRGWDVLATLPWGVTTTYGEIVLPCHRVIGSDGTLTGYAGGVERKAMLLRLEGVASEADQASLF